MSSEEQEVNDFEIIRQMGDLAPYTIVTEEALAKMFKRHGASVRRAVGRGELPPPIRMFGKPCWTVRAIRDHVEQQLACAHKEHTDLQDRINRITA